jgi:hypothetical protein
VRRFGLELIAAALLGLSSFALDPPFALPGALFGLAHPALQIGELFAQGAALTAVQIQLPPGTAQDVVSTAPSARSRRHA